MTGSKNKRVLVVDDDAPTRELLHEVLTEAGYDCTAVQDGLCALSQLASGEPFDLVFSDVNMPGMNGIDVLRTVKAVNPTLPVVLVSGLYELELGIDALRSGAADYLIKPFKPNSIVEMAERHLGPGVRRTEILFQESLDRLLECHTNDQLSTEQLLDVFETLGLRRYETRQHSRRVADYSMLLGCRCELTHEELQDLRLGALLHDVGKLAIPHNILMKPGPLDPDEWTVMRLHPGLGWEMLEPFSQLTNAAEIVRSHHERWDGQGYSRGLRRDAIPIEARVFAVADTFDAMISDRPYRKGRAVATARSEIVELAGAQFDPEVVRKFDQISDLELAEIRRRHPDGAQ